MQEPGGATKGMLMILIFEVAAATTTTEEIRETVTQIKRFMYTLLELGRRQ